MFRQAMFKVLTGTALQSRAAVASQIGKSFHGKRDLYEALGYPNENELTYAKFYAHYLRTGLAYRLINAEPDGCWAQMPDILESTDKDTQFEEDYASLFKRLRLGNVFARADKLSRIGQYGVLLMGFDDVKNEMDLKNPVKPKSGNNGRKLLYVQPYGEDSALIDTWETDTGSERYGLPLLYKVKIQQVKSGSSDVNSTKTVQVHYSRVLHIAEECMESNVFAVPYLKAGFNRLLDVEKIAGSSGEGFWQGAFPGYVFTTDENADFTDTGAGTGTDLATALETEIDLFVHDFKRYMKLINLKVEKLSPEVADPTNHIKAALMMVSITYGVPMRILLGSERGELASGQDEVHWNKKLEERRKNHCEPVILRPFIDKMIDLGVVAEPGADGYEVEWPDLNSPTEKDVADVGNARSTALKNYATAGPDMELLLPFDSFLSEIMNLPDESVERIIDARKKANGEMLREDVMEEEPGNQPPHQEGAPPAEEGELDNQTVEGQE